VGNLAAIAGSSDSIIDVLIRFIENWWWLVFVFGGVGSGIAAGVRRAITMHHDRRLAIIDAKTRLRGAVAAGPAEPQPVCGCSHHLSFHNPNTSTCAVDDCQCQQYIGPEPLGHIIALPLVDPDARPPAPPRS
jgi:hypothetical protein